MSQTASFSDLVARVRSGDAAAAQELIEQYESELRVLVKVRLRDPGLRRVLDTVDICQSVLANFFVRAAAGQFDLESREDLMALLSQMVRNKVIDHARRETAQRRDQGRVVHLQEQDRLIAGAYHTPSQIVAAQELADRFQKLLPAKDRQVMRLRQEGRTWDEIGRELGASPEALRKSFSRSVDAAAQAAGIATCTMD